MSRSQSEPTSLVLPGDRVCASSVTAPCSLLSAWKRSSQPALHQWLDGATQGLWPITYYFSLAFNSLNLSFVVNKHEVFLLTKTKTKLTKPTTCLISPILHGQVEFAGSTPFSLQTTQIQLCPISLHSLLPHFTQTTLAKHTASNKHLLHSGSSLMLDVFPPVPLVTPSPYHM